MVICRWHSVARPERLLSLPLKGVRRFWRVEIKTSCVRRAAEQSSSAGLLVADQLQVGDGGVEVVFGCETKETGEIYNQEADGILGLGNSEVSLINQVGIL